MVRKILLVALGIGVTASAAHAQNARIELSANAGYTLSDGVSGDAYTVPDVGTFNRVDPKDSFSWGLRAGYLLNDNSEIGFLFDMQPTKLVAGGTGATADVELGDESVYNYHGYYAYNFGYRDASARPYVLLGLGATRFGSLDASLGDMQQKIDGGTKFSGTVALGVKSFPFATPKLGLRAEARWTPTYIKSDPNGWWCGYWGCYATSSAQYANQFEFTGGVVLRL